MKKLGSTLKPGTIPAATFAAAYTQLLHLIGTAVSAVPAMLAPVAAGVFGVHPARVGVLIAICFIVSIPTGLLTAGFVSRFGAARTGSFIAATSALSMLGMAVAGYGATWAGAGGVLSVWWFVALLVVVAVLLGFPLGMINPLSSQILFRASPTRLRAFFFSVKQTAVPGAYAVAGLVVPALLLLLSWQATLLVLTLGTLLWTLLTLTVFVEVNPPAAGRPSFRRTFIDPVVTVTRSPPLREMGIVSMLFSMNQTVMSAYLVSYLNLAVGLSLVAAGAIFAANRDRNPLGAGDLFRCARDASGNTLPMASGRDEGRFQLLWCGTLGHGEFLGNRQVRAPHFDGRRRRSMALEKVSCNSRTARRTEFRKIF